MNIDRIAAQVRQVATAFRGNVAGAASYANGVASQVWLPLPAAYVIPLGQDAEPNNSATGLQQILSERFAVIVVLATLYAGGERDLADRRGQAATASLDQLRAEIFRAILNWRPDFDPQNPEASRESQGIYFIGADGPEAQHFDNARFFYQFSFGIDSIITDQDGWQQPFDELREVDINLTDVETRGTVASGQVVFPAP